MIIPRQHPEWWNQSPTSNRTLRSMSDADLATARAWGYFACQGTDAGRVYREQQRRIARAQAETPRA